MEKRFILICPVLENSNINLNASLKHLYLIIETILRNEGEMAGSTTLRSRFEVPQEGF